MVTITFFIDVNFIIVATNIMENSFNMAVIVEVNFNLEFKEFTILVMNQKQVKSITTN